MKLSEFIKNGVSRVSNDAYSKSELMKTFVVWQLMAENLEKTIDALQKGGNGTSCERCAGTGTVGRGDPKFGYDKECPDCGGIGII